jgi:hypothetical protein
VFWFDLNGKQSFCSLCLTCWVVAHIFSTSYRVVAHGICFCIACWSSALIWTGSKVSAPSMDICVAMISHTGWWPTVFMI